MAKKSPSSQVLLERVQSGFFIAPCCAILAALFLFIDLGSPDRAWLIILTPFQSIVSLGAWLVILFIGVSGGLALCGLMFNVIPRPVLVACWGVGSLLSVGVMLYTGLLLSDLVAVDFWYTWILPVLFVASSLSTGFAAMLGWNSFFPLRAGESKAFDKIFVALSVAEIVILAAFILDRFFFSEAARYSCNVLLFGEYAIPFWLGVCFCGFILPWFVQVFDRIAKIPAMKIVSSGGILVAGLCLRYCIIGAAAFTPVMMVLNG